MCLQVTKANTNLVKASRLDSLLRRLKPKSAGEARRIEQFDRNILLLVKAASEHVWTRDYSVSRYNTIAEALTKLPGKSRLSVRRFAIPVSAKQRLTKRLTHTRLICWKDLHVDHLYLRIPDARQSARSSF